MTQFIAEWQSYLRHVLPRNASDVQREECRRAFYAGGMAAYNLALKAVADPNESVCDSNLRTLGNELRSITRDLRML